MASALEAQQSRRLDDAERLYREAIALAPDSADALHMLGVIRYERRDYAEAKALILRALDLTGWRFPSFRHNLGLVIARANDGDGIGFVHARQREWYASHRAKRRPPDERAPRVAVLIRAYNHARYVEAALESVFAQTYRNVEIVLIDDGSTDGTADVARRTLERSPFPHRMIHRDNRGAAQALNEAFELASAPYVNVLNSDDAFEPLRLQYDGRRSRRDRRQLGLFGDRVHRRRRRRCRLAARPPGISARLLDLRGSGGPLDRLRAARGERRRVER